MGRWAAWSRATRPTRPSSPSPRACTSSPPAAGCCSWKWTSRAAPTHACLKWGGVNAIEKGVKIIQGMIELERLWLAQRRNPLYPPPTITIGQISGGLAGSQVPGECVLKFDVKYLPVEMDRDGRGQPNNADRVKAEVVNWIRTLCAGIPGWRITSRR